MAEAFAETGNGTVVCYETFGDSLRPPLVLIMGLGTQMIAWPDEFCGYLAERFYVVRFDNRDAGRSTHFPELGAPDPVRVFLGFERAPYSLGDMASDAVGLLDALGLDSVHLVGASMGGFIAQLVAASHRKRLRSLSLIMTSTGSRRVGRPQFRLLRRLGKKRPPPRDELEAVQLVLAIAREMGSPGYPFPEEYLRDLAVRTFRRSHDPAGYSRQLAAVLTQTDRSSALGHLDLPCVVVHGLADPLVGVSGGNALARAIPNARFVGLPGMGHDLPRPLWRRITDEITATAEAAELRVPID